MTGLEKGFISRQVAAFRQGGWVEINRKLRNLERRHFRRRRSVHGHDSDSEVGEVPNDVVPDERPGSGDKHLPRATVHGRYHIMSRRTFSGESPWALSRSACDP